MLKGLWWFLEQPRIKCLLHSCANNGFFFFFWGPPTMWEAGVRFLGWEDPLEKAWQPTPVLLPGKIPWKEKPDRLQSMGHKELDTTERFQFLSSFFSSLRWMPLTKMGKSLNFCKFSSYVNQEEQGLPYSVLVKIKVGNISVPRYWIISEPI